MHYDRLKEEALGRLLCGKNTDALQNDCDLIIFLLENCEIEVRDEDRFFVKVNCNDIPYQFYRYRARPFKHLLYDNGLWDGMEALAYTGMYDFSHTSAEWESVISLGIYGLKKRIEEYAGINKDTELTKDFYASLIRVYDASLEFMKRAADTAAEHGKTEMAKSLYKLCAASPSNLYEALQTAIVYYTLQFFFDGTYLRTLGRLDRLFYPFYQKEEKETARQMLFDFIKEIDTLEAPSNIPFAICGSDENADDTSNELSHILVDIYGEAQTYNTKFHILCSEKTPAKLIERAMDYVRNGNNSIVFMSDGKIIESLKKQGASHRDAVNYHVVGCYECGADGELTCSCNARVNIPKALELALTGGYDMLTGKLIGLESNCDFDTYEKLELEFERQLRHMCSCAMKATDIYEANYRHIHSAPILSGTYLSALQRGGDLYADYTAKYNSSSVNGIGLATATDSLAAIKKAVYEDGILTIAEFTEVLKQNWNEKEYLRLLIKNKYPKFGQGDKSTDNIAKRIVDVISDAVSYKPNAKGGKYRLGLFSINWRWDLGEKTAASADGRLSGETLSQNTSASFGADKNGTTAHLLSVASIDSSKTPNGAIADIDLHSSAVRGENGLRAIVTSLRTYFELGGFAVHYNVLDTETLKDAKRNPDKYPNLQVRLCGWNVLFSSLSEKEKDEFIERSMR
jgi:formate C-acetyltransferase